MRSSFEKYRSILVERARIAERDAALCGFETKETLEKRNCSVLSRRRQLLSKRVKFIIATMAMVLLVVFLIISIGMEIEQYHVRNSPGTLSFYETDQVCALENLPIQQLKTQYEYGRQPIPLFAQTLPNSSVAQHVVRNESDMLSTSSPSSSVIMHCGACGQCSNPHDINIYAATKVTLFDTTLGCGKHAIFLGRKATSKCMQEKVGFTAGCNDCWVENIMCDVRHCILSCMFEAIVSAGLSTQGQVHTLNRCTQCDEIRCGPQFIQCAGANRRRSAILTDLKRNDSTEVCKKVSPPNWYDNQALRQLWESQQSHQYEGLTSSSSPLTQSGEQNNPHDVALPPSNYTVTTSSNLGGEGRSRRLGGQR